MEERDRVQTGEVVELPADFTSPFQPDRALHLQRSPPHPTRKQQGCDFVSRSVSRPGFTGLFP